MVLDAMNRMEVGTPRLLRRARKEIRATDMITDVCRIGSGNVVVKLKFRHEKEPYLSPEIR